MRLTGNRIAVELARYVAEREAAPFDWQSANCCHFAAGWVARATGADPMAGFPATPDAQAALQLIGEHGDLRGLVSHALGRDPIPAAMAQTGDLLLMPAEGATGFAVGICSGIDAIVIDEAGAVTQQPAAGAMCAWRLYGAPAA